MNILEQHQASVEDRLKWRSNYTSDPSTVMIQRMLRKKAGLRILDVGCGEGGGILRDASKLNAVYGLDCDARLIEAAKANGYAGGFAIDIGNYPFPFCPPSNDPYDIVFSRDTLEHIVDTDHVISQCRRVLKPDGELILCVPSVRTPISFLVMLLLNRPPMYAAGYKNNHVRDFTSKTLKQAVRINGFVITSVIGAGFAVGPVKQMFGWLSRPFPSWASRVIIRAQPMQPKGK